MSYRNSAPKPLRELTPDDLPEPRKPMPLYKKCLYITIASCLGGIALAYAGDSGWSAKHPAMTIVLAFMLAILGIGSAISSFGSWGKE